MEETKIMEQLDSKLTQYKESFETMKSELKESLSANHNEFVTSMDETTKILESFDSKFSEADLTFENMVDLLESFQQRINALEASKSKKEMEDEEDEDSMEEMEDEDDMKAKEKKMKQYAEELGYSVDKKEVSKKESLAGNEQDLSEKDGKAKMSMTEFLKSSQFKEAIKKI